ncbi:uncharacterized protein FIESC28_04216 [Fusarium coffeatum]|uniref:Uncharacterized protein n=1 Tax=Fusarium coffeatum TaxID=231269 RepID=A0A366S241_9HYPO|nr:uncharacterized protein FIESC28_04216 [Fusarium coffeatum]RBR22918.1 hypothetical protein FIESC28_04216 [Fusarium coffeatum]
MDSPTREPPSQPTHTSIGDYRMVNFEAEKQYNESNIVGLELG